LAVSIGCHRFGRDDDIRRGGGVEARAQRRDRGSTISHADVTPVAMLLSESVALSVREDSTIRSARDLVERLRKDVMRWARAVKDSGAKVD
jgi:tripartite-type tricarboxylate transporter receptor subunit TctC